jgi:hypothetical protein
MPGYFISINTSTTAATLFVPAPSADYAVWNGHVYSKQQLQELYDVDDVLYTNETSLFASRLPPTTTVYTIDSSVALPTPILQFTVNRNTLGSFVTTCTYISFPFVPLLIFAFSQGHKKRQRGSLAYTCEQNIKLFSHCCYAIRCFKTQHHTAK